MTEPLRSRSGGQILIDQLKIHGVDMAFGVPGDWFRGERMVRAGVRLGLVDWVTYDYYPSSLWGSDAPTS